MTRITPRITLWRTITALIFAVGTYATYLRFVKGWAAATNLSDAQPWGIWVGVGTLCGVGLSAGGFAIAAAVYLLGLERYRPIVRSAVMLAFLGYASVCFGYLYELGLPWRLWHPIVYWNKASVLFEVCWCIILYTTVLALEFSPTLVEKIPWKGVREFYLHWQHKILVAVVLVGVLLSSLHQSFLGGLFIIFKGKEYPLWYSNYETTLFYMSAIPAGMAMIIMALHLCKRSLGVKIEDSLLREVSGIITPMVVLWGLFRFVDLSRGHALGYLFRPVSETAYFWLEIALFVLAPIVLLNMKRVRNSPVGLYWAAAITVMGFITYRVNVSITALDRATGANYVPKWPEMAIMVMTITGAVLIFRWAVIHLEIFPREAQPAPEATPARRWMANAGVPASA